MMFTGKEIYLRVLEEEDLERTHEWINDPAINQAMNLRGPVSRLRQRKWFENLCNDSTKVVFAICLKASGEHIGNASLRDIDFLSRSALYSIFIGKEEHRGKGIGTEATRLCLRYAFKFLNLHKVYWKTTSTNRPAIRMYEKLGVSKEGCWKEHEYKDGKYVDKLLFAAFKKDFDVYDVCK